VLPPRDVTSECPMARAHGRIDATLELITALLVVTTANIERLGATFYVAVVGILAIIHFVLLFRFLPYYSLATNQMMVALSLIQLWAAVCMIASQIQTKTVRMK
jgi:hypothetical protein